MNREKLLQKNLEKYEYRPAEQNKNGSHIAENYTTPYPIVDTFYEMGSGTYPKKQDGFFLPPEQLEFAVQLYKRCKKYAEGDHQERFTERYKPGWIERFKRAWSSLVRDVHFSYIAQKFSILEKQKYSIEYDKKQNVDLIGQYNGKTVFISLYVGTKQGYTRTRQKLPDRQDATDILVPLRPNGVKQKVETKNDDVWLYTQQHITAINELLRTDSSEVWLQDNQTVIEQI